MQSLEAACTSPAAPGDPGHQGHVDGPRPATLSTGPPRGIGSSSCRAEFLILGPPRPTDGIAFGGGYPNCRSQEAVSGRRCLDATAIRASPRQGFVGRIGTLAASPACRGDRPLESVRLEVDAIALPWSVAFPGGQAWDGKQFSPVMISGSGAEHLEPAIEPDRFHLTSTPEKAK